MVSMPASPPPPEPPPLERSSPPLPMAEAGHEADDLAHPAIAFLPARLLYPGELIILLIKPSPLYILLAPAGTLAIIAILTSVLFSLARNLTIPFNPRDILLLGVLATVVRLFWQFLEWLSRVYVLTDRRIIRVQGVLRVSVFEAALNKVQHTTTTFSLRERLFGLGSIGFATAGTDLIDVWWVMLSRPLDVHQTILQTIGRYRR
jgi:hypothetical protein